MKRFTVPAQFAGQSYPFHVYVGDPAAGKHALRYQAQWLAQVRGGAMPQEVMDSFERLLKIARENSVSFEDLCVYALGTATEEKKPEPERVETDEDMSLAESEAN